MIEKQITKSCTFCFSNTYPDKLQSLLQSIAMSDYAILNISQLDSFLGEQIIALDIFNIKNGFILHNYNIDIEKIKNIIKKTNLSNYLILDNIEELKSNIMQLQAKDKENEKKENDHNENGSITSTASTLSTLKDSIK